MINQDTAHEPGRDAIKLRATLPANFLLLQELEIHFVNERCGLQAVIGALCAHLACRHAPQLLVDKRYELTHGILIAVTELPQQSSHLSGWGRHVIGGRHVPSSGCCNSDL